MVAANILWNKLNSISELFWRNIVNVIPHKTDSMENISG
jgi:hypothetical protein